MSAIELSVSDWLGLLSHVKKWLANLLRAGPKRKADSKQALRNVVRAVRRTEVYVRHLRENGQKAIDTEEELSSLWTELSFSLEDLGLGVLAKRCRIKGQYWADPSRFDQEFLDKAGVKLSEIEKIARLTLNQLND